MAEQAAEKGSEECPQALKRIECKPFMSELKLRPPKKRPFSRNCEAMMIGSAVRGPEGPRFHQKCKSGRASHATVCRVYGAWREIRVEAPPSLCRVGCAPIVCFQRVTGVSIRRECRVEMKRSAVAEGCFERHRGLSFGDPPSPIGLRRGGCSREDVARRVMRRSLRRLFSCRCSSGATNAPDYNVNHIVTLLSRSKTCMPLFNRPSGTCDSAPPLPALRCASCRANDNRASGATKATAKCQAGPKSVT